MILNGRERTKEEYHAKKYGFIPPPPYFSPASLSPWEVYIPPPPSQNATRIFLSKD